MKIITDLVLKNRIKKLVEINPLCSEDECIDYERQDNDCHECPYRTNSMDIQRLIDEGVVNHLYYNACLNRPDGGSMRCIGSCSDCFKDALKLFGLQYVHGRIDVL